MRDHYRRNNYNPLVSVLLPTYNGASTIGGCIESLLNQSYQNVEIIVIDDGSADETYAVVSKYPVKYYRIPHGGRAQAVNFGLRRARGEIVAVVEDDAVYLPNYLREVVKHFEDPLVGVVMGPHYVLDPKSFVEKCKDLERRVHFTDYVPYTGWVFRKNLLEKVGGFDESVASGDEVITSRRIASLGYKIVFEPKAVWLHREPDNIAGLLRDRFRGGINRAIYGIRHGTKPLSSSLSHKDLNFVRELRKIRIAAQISHSLLLTLGYIMILYLGRVVALLGLVYGKMFRKKSLKILGEWRPQK